MAFSYFAFGLRVSSAIELTEFKEEQPSVGFAGAADVIIRWASLPGLDPLELRSIVPNLWANSTCARFDIPGVAKFLIRDGREILVDPMPGVSEDSVRLFLVGSAFGALLMQQGRLVLHANAVRIGNDCMICCGASGVGKSTLAAGFMLRGYGILADDVAAIEENGYAQEGVRRIKLWRDVAERLGFDSRSLKKLSPDLDKFSLPLDTSCATGSFKVRWIYVLQSGPTDRLVIEPLAGMKRFESLHDNTYRLPLIEGMDLKQAHLRQCGMLANRAHIARVTRPYNGFNLDALVDGLLEDFYQNS